MACSNVVAGEAICRSAAAVTRSQRPGMQVMTLARPTHQEIFISAAAAGTPAGAVECFRAIAARLREAGARVVCLEAFGLAAAESLPALRAAFGEINFPVTWLEEGCASPARRAGVEVWAVTDLSVEPIRVDGQVVGVTFEDGCLRVCRLGGLGQASPALTAEEQTRLVFERMAEILTLAGMSFDNVVRTWFFNHRILDWYGGFNRVRTAFFKENLVFEGLVPASTGVGGANIHQSALTAGLLALAPVCDSTRIFAVPSPLQCPALEYGSAFSRAVEIALPDHRRLMISGTASIAPEGHTVHLDDVDKQVALSMEVAGAILESRGMGWGDVSRAIGYFKRIEDAPAFERWAAAQGLAEMPIVLVKEDICRDDLLFEVELDAVQAGGQ